MMNRFLNSSRTDNRMVSREQARCQIRIQILDLIPYEFHIFPPITMTMRII